VEIDTRIQTQMTNNAFPHCSFALRFAHTDAPSSVFAGRIGKQGTALEG
jgi:hypothetical protein